jgi:hypothetical protein
MAAWPLVAELKQKLDITSTDWDDHLSRILASAIEQVQIDIGEDVDEPTSSLAAAALILAVDIGSTEGEGVAQSRDVAVAALNASSRLPKYQRLLKGHRVRFGLA